MASTQATKNSTANRSSTAKKKTTTTKKSTAATANKSRSSKGTQKKNTGKRTASSGSRSASKSKNEKTVQRKQGDKETWEEEILTPEELALRGEIRFFVSLFAVLLATLSMFGVLGSVGMKFAEYILFGVFGLTAYIVPIGLLLAIGIFIANMSSGRFRTKFFAGIGMFFVLLIFAQLFFGENQAYLTMADYYQYAMDHHSGGGIIGGLIVKGISYCIGIVGTYIVAICAGIICFMLLTGTSVTGSIKSQYHQARRSYDDMYEKSRENVERKNREKQKKLARKLQQEKIERRAGKKVRGVAMKDTRIMEEKAAREEIHEITGQYPADQVFRGHVELEEEEDTVRFPWEEQESFYSTQEGIEQSHDRANEFLDRERDSFVTAKQQVKESSPNMVVELSSASEEGEEGEFTPKEKIIVSRRAVNEMKRKPFASTPLSDVQGTQKGNIPSDEKEQKEKMVSNRSVDKQGSADSAKAKVKKEFKLPPLSLLTKPQGKAKGNMKSELNATAALLQKTLETFGVKVKITNYSKGPSVTRYELQPEMGTKVSKITSLADDIKLNLAASDIRIEAPIPGKAAVGIEVPNKSRESVLLRELIESKELSSHPSKLAFAAGKDIAGNVVVADIAKMPHMLVAGTTGSGKSVFTNSIIMSILFRAKPDEVKLIIVDPKVVEFGVYNGIPHLLIPVVTDPKKAAGALNWAVAEMSERYKKFAAYNVRDLKGYNQAIEEHPPQGEEEKPEKMPQIVIIIDELADLMMVAAKEVESSICRLAQLARAAGIHLVIATQRPSVDVVTGLIKANIPSRVALLVSSGTDSRTIIDMNGAEKLLGNGDMLFYPSGYVKPVRLQGAFVSDGEVQKVVSYLVDQCGDIEYNSDITQQVEENSASVGNEAMNVSQPAGMGEDGRDEYFADAARFVVEKGKASTSMMQRMFKIGFNRAGRMMDQLEEAGIVGAEEGTKPRKVLMSMEEVESLLGQKT